MCGRAPMDSRSGLAVLPKSGDLSLRRKPMRTALAVLISLFFVTPTLAQSACEALAVGKDGKPLSGAAKAAFVKKCKKDSTGH